MKTTTLALVTLITLLETVSLSFARTVDSCVSMEVVTDVSKLEQELDRVGIKYRTESNALCVSQDQREQFLRIISKVIPASPSESRNIRVPQSPSGIPVNSTKLTDLAQHNMLQEELKRQNIWFAIDDNNGALWYEVTREDQVRELTFKIIENDIPVDRSIHYSQAYSRALFKAELDKNGVSYQPKIRQNEEWIVWKGTDTPRVKEIMNFVDEQTSEYFKKQRENQKRSQSN